MQRLLAAELAGVFVASDLAHGTRLLIDAVASGKTAARSVYQYVTGRTLPVCTHFGCIVKPTAEGFECPCHGSRLAADDGSVTLGPAPQPLRWLKVSASGEQWVVDEAAIVPAGTKVNA